MSQLITIPQLCREAGVSDRTARRYFAESNAYRAAGGWHRFSPENKADALAFIESRRQRKCRNAFNTRLISPSISSDFEAEGAQ